MIPTMKFLSVGFAVFFWYPVNLIQKWDRTQKGSKIIRARKTEENNQILVQYDSGSGWPSFWDVVDKQFIRCRSDASAGMQY